MAKGTPAGVEAKGYMDKGNLVPDALIAAMIKDVIDETTGDVTMLLDGFPRNVAQAEVLEKSGAPVRSVVLVDVPDAIIADRIAGRRTCPKCKAGYHVKALPPKVAQTIRKDKSAGEPSRLYTTLALISALCLIAAAAITAVDYLNLYEGQHIELPFLSGK